jgi:hypothetical protein
VAGRPGGVRLPVQELMGRSDDSVAYAANWRAVLAADAGAGVVLAAIGLAVIAFANILFGALLVALGAAYVVLVARRARHWAALRREAGL